MNLSTIHAGSKGDSTERPRGETDRSADLSQAHLCTSAEPLDGRQLRVMLLVSSLDFGGAERQVVNLANHLDPARHDVVVCSLSDRLPLADALWDRERRLRVVAKQCRFDATVVLRLARMLEALQIDVVHAFLFDAEIAARLARVLRRRLRRRVAVIGSERNSDYSIPWHHGAARRVTRRLVDAVIANSDAGRRFQIQTVGVAPDRVFVVRNGVDVQRFQPRDSSAARAALDLDPACPVVGMFCSFKRQKNHAMFFRAARHLLDLDPRTRFLCVGEPLHGGLQQSEAYRREMLAMATAYNVTHAIRFLGNRNDVVELYNACDVVVLTSRREGTPNVLLEAMACGVPVVATDVADNAFVVRDGHAGYVVPLDDDRSMADRLSQLFQQSALRTSLGQNARAWVEREFSLQGLAANTAGVYDQVLARKRAGSLA